MWNHLPLLKTKGVLWVSLKIASTSGWMSARDCKIPKLGLGTSLTFDSISSLDDCKTKFIGNPRGQHGVLGAPSAG